MSRRPMTPGRLRKTELAAGIARARVEALKNRRAAALRAHRTDTTAARMQALQRRNGPSNDEGRSTGPFRPFYRHLWTKARCLFPFLRLP